MPGRSLDDEPREDLATLTVERMDGLRIDRLELRLVTLDEGSTGVRRRSDDRRDGRRGGGDHE